MKVRSAIKALCPHCYIVKRGKRRYVYCKVTPKHKQRQGFHTMTAEPEAFDLSTQQYCFFSVPSPALPKVDLLVAESHAVSGVKLNPILKYDPVIGVNSVLY